MSGIFFFSENIKFEIKNKNTIRNWIRKVVQKESNKTIDTINFVFCSDNYLYTINEKYLNHKTLTDIITFDHSENNKTLESDIFISIPRIKENSQVLGISFLAELHRVMIHGILHLLGYQDHTEDEKKFMREKENECLTLLEI